MARCPDCIHQYCCKYDRFFGVNEVENKCIYFKPSADVADVVYAKWEISSDGYYPYCSHCKTEPENGVMSKYCPECGAMMDSAEKFPNNTEHSVDVNKMVQNQWISVDKQLPETYIEVLVSFKADGTNVIAFVNRFGKWKNASTDNFIESEITHWMPLPEPPKGVIKK